MYIHTYIAENDRTTGHTNKEVTRATATKAATTTRTVSNLTHHFYDVQISQFCSDNFHIYLIYKYIHTYMCTYRDTYTITAQFACKALVVVFCSYFYYCCICKHTFGDVYKTVRYIFHSLTLSHHAYEGSSKNSRPNNLNTKLMITMKASQLHILIVANHFII